MKPRLAMMHAVPKAITPLLCHDGVHAEIRLCG